MSAPIADRRIELATALRGRVSDVMRLDPGSLRFSLGTSLSETRMPFEVAPDVTGLLARSARQLALMLLSRHRELIPGEEFDPFLVSDEFAALPDIPPTLSPASGGADVRAAAQLAPRLHPLLTGGVLAAWLGPGGGGRSLVALVIECLRRGFAERKESQSREETPTLVALMLASCLPQVEPGLRASRLPAFLERALCAAAGCGMYLALRLGVERALRDAKDVPPELGTRLEAALGPGLLLGGARAWAATGCALYGCELSAGVGDAEQLAGAHPNGLSLEGMKARLEQALKADEGASQRAELAVGLAELRERLLQAVAAGEQGALSADLTQFLRQLAIRPAALAALLADEKARKPVWKELRERADALGGAEGEALAGLSTALKAYAPKEPAAAAGLSRQEARARYARAASAFLCDLWLDRVAAPLRRLLEPRTGAEAEGGLEAEYQAGRLYRLTTRQGPILNATSGGQVAHLFVDVKDFTRRTSLLGQAAMADFLRREFYLPLLTAAKARYGGLSHLADRGGVSLNNLLGDALSLSGEVEALVSIAVEFRRHLASYARRLALAVSSELVERAVQAIRTEYAQKLQGAPPGELGRLRQERETAILRARGEGLEAGVFISFGPAPLVVTFEDEIFGRARVAIADRINESARGTARAGSARARADALLLAERERREEPGLAHPWQVFIGTPLAIPVPYAAEAAARAALAGGDPEGALAALLEPVRQALRGATAQDEESPGEIYNAGIALSDEALQAYREAVRGRRVFRELTLDPGALHPEIHELYFFAPGPLRLLAAFTPNGALAEVFRFAGRVLFKGFESKGSIGVWELADETRIAQLFARHHAAAWFREGQ